MVLASRGRPPLLPVEGGVGGRVGVSFCEVVGVGEGSSPRSGTLSLRGWCRLADCDAADGVVSFDETLLLLVGPASCVEGTPSSVDLAGDSFV